MFRCAHHTLCRVEESIARVHDTHRAEALRIHEGISVYDRGYVHFQWIERWEEQGHRFVIRLRKNAILWEDETWTCPMRSSPVVYDGLAFIGCESKMTKKRYWVVTFLNDDQKPIHVVTNLWTESAETIAEIYRTRWQVEVFFRWIKQQLQVKQLMGTCKNSVYNQLYGALIAYVLLRWLYQQTQPHWKFIRLTFTEFVRKVRLEQLPKEAAYWVSDLIFTQLRSFSFGSFCPIDRPDFN
ncbi:IS4 family transposase [Paludifilum halophilum]|uniref:Transposase IS4-like domain-containing protein n=1 Tax=Paludifilum halophilum TaxID=1642702 RepID=A0A235B3W6_9BACL|nr:IS4 family transposase [Paludifilum halophilum]OYD06921.1 hypothetical protein CHM34_13345 [Paludifilum halophilum]